MTYLFPPEGDGHTALSEEDRIGLLLPEVATRGDLYGAEQRNISRALMRPLPTARALLDDRFLRNLHRAMFGRVWRWAGQYRLRETNIGIEPGGIAVAVRLLVQDVAVWVEHGTYELDEICVRFHHRLVFVHPFPNGNGRHARVCADLLGAALGVEPFSWGINMGLTTSELRRAYHTALRAADAGEMQDIVVFARS